MKHVQLVHNPDAGDGDFDKKELISVLREKGYDCEYFSTKEKEWKDFAPSGEMLIVAGGDGTVRKVVEKVLEAELLIRPESIGLLPLGTANNIGHALGINGSIGKTIDSWKRAHTCTYDIGALSGLKEHGFFMEGFGFGLFPELMREMKKSENSRPENAEEDLERAIDVLHKVAGDFEPRYCNLIIDGTDHSGKFLLAEIMNNPSIGPNLKISPESDPCDGQFEVVLIPERDKKKFMTYLSGKQNGREKKYAFRTFRGKQISIEWDGNRGHVDDRLFKHESCEKIEVEIREGLVGFLVGKE